MAKTKQQLKVENNTQFPNNNTNFITPAKLREFNVDMIDSTVNELEYIPFAAGVNAFTASVDSRVTTLEGEVDTLQASTGSYATTGSNTFVGNQTINGNVAATTFTGDGSGLTNLPSATPTGSLLVTASAAGSTITFTKGDASTFDVTVSGGTTTPTGSLLVTASAAGNTITFTKGDASTFNVTVSGGTVNTGSFVTTSSFNAYTGSANTRLSSLEVATGSLNASVGGLNIFSASQKVLNTTFATTGSNTFKGNQTISGSVTITGSLTASGFTYPTVDGLFGVEVVQTDGTGNLSLEIPRTIYEYVKNVSGGTLTKGTPVHSVGTAGFQTEVIAADAGNPSTMPATFILAQDLNDEEEGLGIAIGAIQGVNTVGFTEGDVVYVGVGGGFTQTKPTGSALIQNLGIITKVGVNGGGVVLGAGRSNDIPNLPPNTLWVGNSNWVGTPFSASNFYTGSYTGSFTGDGSGLTNLPGGGGSTPTGSLLVTASAAGNTITFTKGDASTFDVTVSGGTTDTGSFVTTASFNAFTSSYTTGSFTGSFVGDGSGLINVPGGGGSTPTGSLLITASFSSATLQFTKGDSTQFDLILFTSGTVAPNNASGSNGDLYLQYTE